MWLDSEPVGGCVAEYRAISQIRRDVGRVGFRTRVPSHGKPCYAASWGIACSTNRKNRVLRIPATTFVITHSPSRSNRRDGFGFSEERRGRATEQVRLRASVTGSIENDRRAFAVDRAFRDATRALIQLKSGDGRSRSTRKLPLSVFAIKSGAGVRIFSGAPLAPMTYFMQAVLI